MLRVSRTGQRGSMPWSRTVSHAVASQTVTAHLGTLVCVGSLKNNKKGNIISAQVWHHKVEVHESGANGTYHVVQLRTAVAAAVATVTRRPVTSVTPPRLDQWDCEVWPQASVLLTSKNTFWKIRFSEHYMAFFERNMFWPVTYCVIMRDLSINNSVVTKTLM